MSAATPATPATPAKPASTSSTKTKVKVKANVAAKLVGVVADLVFGVVAFLIAAWALDQNALAMIDSGFWPSIGMILVIPLVLLAIWLAVDDQLIKSRAIRYLIVVILLIVAVICAVNGVRPDAINWPIFWSAFWVIVTVFVEALLFWLRRHWKKV